MQKPGGAVRGRGYFCLGSVVATATCLLIAAGPIAAPPSAAAADAASPFTPNRLSPRGNPHPPALAGEAAPAAREMAKLVIYTPDFPRKPQRGLRRAAGQAAPGVLRYVLLRDGAKARVKAHRAYRYSDGLAASLEARGIAAGAIALADPVKGARLTSGFGWRMHPVLHVRKFHYGVDLAAPVGTPVHAAADGVVEEAGRHGANGLYLRIRHDTHLTTTYSHLKRLAAGVRRGTRVSRDQVIASVGSTGLATGPHLYYEVLIDGQQVDPLRPKILEVKLQGDELARIARLVQMTDRLQ